MNFTFTSILSILKTTEKSIVCCNVNVIIKVFGNKILLAG